MASQSGSTLDEVVIDALNCSFDRLALARERLDRRYDDLESGKVQAIDGEEAFRRLMEKNEAKRHRSA